MPSAAAVPPARAGLVTSPLAALPSPSTNNHDDTLSTASVAAVRADSIAVRTGSSEAAHRIQLAAIRRVLAAGGPEIVYQPQLSLSRMLVEGYEALARFPETPIRGTELWFTRAREFGLGAALEASALEQALRRQDERPAGTTLALNISPGVLTSAAVAAALPADLTGIEIELTEHEWSPQAGSGRLRRELDLLRERGAKVAIDDVGAAHSGLRRVMELAPDRIKLDRHLVVGVSGNTVKAALIRAVVYLADQIGATVCAEGVENIDDLEALADLDVGYAQGWVIGLPHPDFQDAEPLAITASRDSLVSMLSGAKDLVVTHDPIGDVEHLQATLSTVTSLTELDALVGTCAGVLGGIGGGEVKLSVVVGPEGRSIAPLTLQRAGAGTLRLADFPTIQRCLDTRTLIPVYVGIRGDAAEWFLLQQLNFEAELLVPVISRGRVIGLLQCYRRTPESWTRRQIRSARTIAAMLGPVLDVLNSTR
jgi:EAL domain-containing protein (putative c-di-GMP-specific phosphodiesterase class I)